ncbi:MAG TPA: helix-turn-helix transcriptional regulator [Burkholderiales bacterium]
MRLTQQDFDEMLDFVALLYDRDRCDGFAGCTMAALCKLLGAERIVYGTFDLIRQSAALHMQPEAVGASGSGLAAFERSFADHPLYRYYLQTGDGRAQKSSQALARQDLEHYRRHDCFAREFGARHQMAVFFAAGPSTVTAVVLTRGGHDFSERERGILNRLYPHLVQATRRAASLNLHCRDMDALVDMLEGPSSSVIVLAGDGRVERWSAQARQWIARYCRTPAPANTDRLPDCFAQWYRRQLERVAQGCGVTQPRDVLLVEKDGRQLSVQLVPDHLRDEHLLLLNEKRGDASWCSLGLHGLTPRESEVLAWVAKGKTNAEVGTILQLSSRTVQKHLEHIYQKLGVGTRTTATVRALGMLHANELD